MRPASSLPKMPKVYSRPKTSMSSTIISENKSPMVSLWSNVFAVRICLWMTLQKP